MLGSVGEGHQLDVLVQSGHGEIGRSDQEGLRGSSVVAGGPDLEVGLGAPLVGAVGAVPVEYGHVAALNEAESGAAVGGGGLREVAALHVADEQGHGPTL